MGFLMNHNESDFKAHFERSVCVNCALREKCGKRQLDPSNKEWKKTKKILGPKCEKLENFSVSFEWILEMEDGSAYIATASKSYLDEKKTLYDMCGTWKVAAGLSDIDGIKEEVKKKFMYKGMPTKFTEQITGRVFEICANRRMGMYNFMKLVEKEINGEETDWVIKAFCEKFLE